MIPYGRQSIDLDDVKAVTDALQSRYITTGPKIEEFEQRISKYVGAKYAVAVSSGTAALHTAMFAAGIKEGDEIITTPLTFVATANAILYLKGRPVFADICADTLNIDPDAVHKAITPRTKAIVPVDFAGQPCDYERILTIAKEHGLIIIEDGAHALGASWSDRRVGSISDLTTFSFHPVKAITTGEGGTITTDDSQMANRMRMFRNHGITTDYRERNTWQYDMAFLGYNYRLSDIACALGISQLSKIGERVLRRLAHAERYTVAINRMEGIRVPKILPGHGSAWHIYPILVEDRAAVYERMRSRGIGVNVHYAPVYFHTYYQKMGYKEGICPNAEWAYRHLLTLPLYPDMTFEDIDFVLETLSWAMAK